MPHYRRSWTCYLSTPVVLNLVTLGPIGYWKAPGTLGSLVGLIFYWVAMRQLNSVPYILITLFLLYFAVALCGEAEVRLGKKDPPEVILDEFVVVPVCFLGLEDDMAKYSAVLVLLLAFVVYRFLDIRKPYLIYKLQAIRGGWGVVVDDLAAALVTNGLLHVLFFLLPFVLQ